MWCPSWLYRGGYVVNANDNCFRALYVDRWGVRRLCHTAAER